MFLVTMLQSLIHNIGGPLVWLLVGLSLFTGGFLAGKWHQSYAS